MRIAKGMYSSRHQTRLTTNAIHIMGREKTLCGLSTDGGDAKLYETNGEIEKVTCPKCVSLKKKQQNH